MVVGKKRNLDFGGNLLLPHFVLSNPAHFWIVNVCMDMVIYTYEYLCFFVKKNYKKYLLKCFSLDLYVFNYFFS